MKENIVLGLIGVFLIFFLIFFGFTAFVMYSTSLEANEILGRGEIFGQKNRRY